jgi:hypothetical protein
LIKTKSSSRRAFCVPPIDDQTALGCPDEDVDEEVAAQIANTATTTPSMIPFQRAPMAANPRTKGEIRIQTPKIALSHPAQAESLGIETSSNERTAMIIPKTTLLLLKVVPENPSKNGETMSQMPKMTFIQPAVFTC